MDFNQLRMFMAVAEHGNLTHAAERLHISQPAASAQIKQLEDEFKVALFQRKSSGLKLTRAGSALLPKVQQLLATATEIATQARSLSGQVTGMIKFGAVASVVVPQIVEVINRMITCHPSLEVELQHNHSHDIKLGVAHGEIDAALVVGNKQVPDLRSVFLQELHYCVVASKLWRRRARDASWEEIACLPWVCCPGTHHEMVMQLFRGFDFRPEKLVKADSQQLINSLVMAGAGLGLMPKEGAIEAEETGNIFIVDRQRIASTNLQFVCRAGRENDPAIQTILHALHELWPQSAQQPSKDRPAKRQSIRRL
jgi:DNA-binding transcriptional LysR family regulator